MLLGKRQWVQISSKVRTGFSYVNSPIICNPRLRDLSSTNSIIHSQFFETVLPAQGFSVNTLSDSVVLIKNLTEPSSVVSLTLLYISRMLKKVLRVTLNEVKGLMYLKRRDSSLRSE